jgi:uncharacterized protein YndB with AHSA1/START domain
MARPFGFDRRFAFGVPPEHLWAVLMETDRYRTWWTWLRRFEAEGLRAGTVADCEVRAPLPYSLRFTVRIDEVVPYERVTTTVTGDLDGPAGLDLRRTADGCEARLWWEVELRVPLLRRAASVARPAMAWAHDRIVDSGIDQFRRRALDGRG